MFDRLLIANRGEIACRIATTARRLGIHTIAVYSDADADARHVALCDEAWHAGPASASASYLRSDRVLGIARRSRADAIHPGYGFLAENAAFARAVTERGLVFVGPPADAIAAMGDKLAAKRLMEKAGVPIVPGYHGDDQSATALRRAAGEIGWPVLIKAALGGGGRGMRIVRTMAQFDTLLAACRREAENAFGDGRVLLERYLPDPRHVEIQIFADGHGGHVHLFERDCSVQRRHQKIVEEAPAPGMDERQRQAMGQTAVAAARAVGYVGAGTVEFIVDATGAFHFMEMNTRLQVEHPVTEMITGIDLVEWQLRIADGQRLPLRQNQLRIDGHAIEARIYAENPENDFLPSPGTLRWLSLPDAVEFGCHDSRADGPDAAAVRIDRGVRQGDTIGSDYDHLIAKLIVHGADRDQALARMTRALNVCQIIGTASNLDFLLRLFGTPAFIDGRLDTGLIERERGTLFPRPSIPSLWRRAMAGAAMLAREMDEDGADRAVTIGAARRRATAAEPAPATVRTRTWRDPWNARTGWRIGPWLIRPVNFVHAGLPCPVQIQYGDGAWLIREPPQDALHAPMKLAAGDDGIAPAAGILLSNLHWRVRDRSRNGDPALRLHCVLGDRRIAFDAVFDGTDVHVSSPLGHDVFGFGDRLARNLDGDDGGPLVAPMPGKVIAVFAEPGTRVERGQALLAIEAMKMEHAVVAPAPGHIENLHCNVGDQVVEGAPLVTFIRADAAHSQ